VSNAAPPPRQRGLPSLNEAREARRRQMATGKARIYGGSPTFWFAVAIALSVFAVVYWIWAQRQLESQKSSVMATQRAVSQAIGPRLLPFVERVEKWVKELGGPAAPNYVDPTVSLDSLANRAGVYLRVRQRNSQDTKSLRDAAIRSLRDGFTSCLFVRREATEGTACQRPSDCKGGLLCNEYGICALPSQPFNLRIVYRTLRILSPEWTDKLHEADTDLKVRAFELDLDAVSKNDVPAAVELLSRARYFTAVLDEDPATGLPAALEPTPTDPPESEEERVQRTPHQARVGVWDVESGKLLVRVRAEAAGEFRSVGDRPVTDPRTVAAQQRQVNSCALALSVKELIVPPEAAPAPAAKP
jgi:hypothetical protein